MWEVVKSQYEFCINSNKPKVNLKYEMNFFTKVMFIKQKCIVS